MSTTIDQKVVEMRFDNQHFEKNVSNTMSTLDKLKQKLHLTGASKGLENISASANKVNMSGLGAAVQTVSAKFSALEVMGVTALANITNSAVNAGKRIVKALTIDPVTTGWNEYELKMGSVQTIMASTGESLDTVNKYLGELNEYSDQTIYSFSDMTQNIGKFTNAGVKLEDAVAAIKGISNEAALSGANANEASRAMYNFAQALSAGYVKLIDWKSIENANMATVEFKEQLLQTALECKTVQKAAGGMYKVLTTNNKGSTMEQTINATSNFNDSLNYQWMTTDVLVKTLNKYADANTKIGAKATQAATEIKTFSQMLDTLKESAQSGWAQTWEIIFGDFYKGKELWTTIGNAIGGVIDKVSDVRNAFAKKVFGSKWDELKESIQEAGLSAEDFEKTVKKIGGKDLDKLIKEYGSLSKAVDKGKVSSDILQKALEELVGVQGDNTKSTKGMTKSYEDYQSVIKKVIQGDWDNGAKRLKKLTEAGYDYGYVQNKVNEILGNSKRHYTELTDEQLKQVGALSRLSDKQLESQGYTAKQIEALRELEKAADGAGGTISELIKDMEKPTGRELVIESFANVCKYFGDILKIVGEAWDAVFGDIDFGQVFYNVIEQMHAFTAELEVGEKNAKNFKTVMEGLFAGFKLGGSIASKSVVAGLKILNAALGLFGTDLVGVAAKIAEYIIAFEEWVEVNTMFGWDTSYDKIAKVFVTIYEGVSKCIKAFVGLDKIQGIIQKFKDLLTDFFGSVGGTIDFFSLDGVVEKIETFFNNVEAWLKGGNSAENLGLYLVEGIVKGLLTAGKKVGSAILEVAITLITAFCDFFGINSPSKLMMAMGVFLILGLTQGLENSSAFLWDSLKGIVSQAMNVVSVAIQNGIPYVIDLFKTIGPKIIDILKELNLGSLVATGFGVGILYTVNRFINVTEKFLAPAKALSGMFSSLKNLIEDLGKSIKTYLRVKTMDKIGNVILNMAISIGILAASLWLISTINPVTLWDSVKALAALAGIVAMLAGVATALQKVGGFDFKIMSIIAIAGAVLILAAAVKKISDMDNPKQSIDTVLQLVLGMVGVAVALAFFTGNGQSVNMDKVGITLLKMSAALLVTTFVIERIGGLSNRAITKGVVVLYALNYFYASLLSVAKDSGEHVSKSGGMLLKMSIAILILVGLIKLISLLEWTEIGKGLLVIGAIELMFMQLIKVSEKTGPYAGKAGAMFLGMGIAITAVVFCLEKISEISTKDVFRGLAVVAALEILFGGLIWVSKYAGEHAAKAGAMLLLMSGALLILTGVLFIISNLNDTAGLWRAVGVVAILEVLFMGLIGVSHFAKDVKGTLIVLIVAISLMTVLLIALTYLPDQSKLVTATACLSTAMIAFALLISSLRWIKSKKGAVKKSIGTLTALLVFVSLLSGLLVALSHFIKPDTAIQAAGGLAILLTSLSTSIWIISNSKEMTPTKLKTVMQAVGLMVPVLVGLAVILAMVSGIPNPMNLIPTVTAMSILLEAMSVSLVILSRGVTKTAKLSDIMGALTSMTFIVGGLSVVLWVLSGIPNPMNLIPTVVAMGLLLNEMSVAMVILSRGVTKTAKLGDIMNAMTTMTLLVVGLSVVLAALSFIEDPMKLIPAVTAMGILLMAMSATLVILSNMVTKTAKLSTIMGAMGELTVIIVGLTVVLHALALIPNPSNLLPTVTAMSALLLAMSVTLVILSNGVTKTAKLNAIMKSMTILTALVLGLTVVLHALALIPNPSNLLPSVTALSILLGAMTVVMVVLSNMVTKTAKLGKIMGAMGELTVIIVGLTVVLHALALIDNPSNLLPSVTALSILLGAMTVAMIALSNLVTKTAKLNTIVAAMGWLTLIIAGLAVVLAGMSKIENPMGLIPTSVALGMLLNKMSTALVILTRFSKYSGSVMGMIGAMAVLGLVVAELAIILGMMSKFDAHAAIGDVLALSTLLMVMTGVLIVLGATSALNGRATEGILALGALSVVVMIIAGILGVMSKYDLHASLEDAQALSLLLLSMSAALVILGFVGSMAGFALAGMGTLAIFVAGLAVLLTALGALSKIDGFNELIEGGMGVLSKIGYALGEFVGSIIGGFSAGIASGLPTLGLSLGQFMVNATPFLVGIKMVDSNMLEKVGALTAAILLLTAADLITGINKMLSFGSSFADLGTELSSFMLNALPFILGMKLVDTAILDGVKTLAEAILLLTAADLIDGLTNWFTGGNSLSEFGGQLEELGNNLRKFKNSLGTFDDPAVKTISCACSALKMLAEAAKTLPNDGGLWGAIVGENSLATFGGDLATVGENMKSFAESVGDFDDSTVRSVDCAAKAIKALADAASMIPNEGGWAAKIFGENSLATFAGDLPNLGTGIASFVSNLGDDWGDGKVKTAESAAGVIVALAKAAKELPNEGGWAAKIFGENSLATFATNLPDLGTHIKDFVVNLGTINESAIGSVELGIKALNAVTKLKDLDLSTSNLSSLTTDFTTLSSGIKSFVNVMGEVSAESITISINKINKLVEFAKSVAGMNLDSLDAFTSSLTDIGTKGVAEFVNAFTDEEPKEKVKSGAKAMLSAFVGGLKDSQKDVNKAFEAVAADGIKKLDTKDIITNAKTAGKNVVQGFADGITNNTWIAEAKAKAMAKAAADAAKKELDINSPSKVFRAIAYSIPEGFAMGIDRMSYMARDSAVNMSDRAIGGVKDAISRISDYVNSDIDSQPTIRPVLDLSDVKSGVGALSGMFDTTANVGVMTNVKSISSMMNNRQNGSSNDDVIAAIRDLSGSLNGNAGNTYNINGITYDDGSAVSNAISTLIRATRIEGRA